MRVMSRKLKVHVPVKRCTNSTGLARNRRSRPRGPGGRRQQRNREEGDLEAGDLGAVSCRAMVQKYLFKSMPV